MVDALAALRSGPPIDKEAAERGRKIFVPTCGFCHGNDAHGKSGPDLVRSPAVLHDNKGDVIGPVIRNGRPERGMPPFSALSAEQIEDISSSISSCGAKTLSEQRKHLLEPSFKPSLMSVDLKEPLTYGFENEAALNVPDIL